MPLRNWEGEGSDEAKSGELPIYHLPFDLRAIGRDLYSFSHVAEKIFFVICGQAVGNSVCRIRTRLARKANLYESCMGVHFHHLRNTGCMSAGVWRYRQVNSFIGMEDWSAEVRLKLPIDALPIP